MRLQLLLASIAPQAVEQPLLRYGGIAPAPRANAEEFSHSRFPHSRALLELLVDDFE
ncbi:hypothetical protein [Variovorax paradoxus]|uniref:hypothetical protein n=1 Tax=Variovorax paradoxus TaxID=34073 RepID=UPI00155E4CA6